jgi:glycine hydroxymethyltransferase
VNKNTVPNEKRSPFVTSGIRVGTPAMTTRGLKELEMRQIAVWIRDAVLSKGDADTLAKIRHQVKELCLRFPVYGEKV